MFIFYILVFKYLKFTLIIVNGFLYYWNIYSCKTKGVLDKTQTTDYKQNNKKKNVLSDFTCKQRAID